MYFFGTDNLPITLKNAVISAIEIFSIATILNELNLICILAIRLLLSVLLNVLGDDVIIDHMLDIAFS